MIVRTAPIILPEPDAMRAMERLEAQLRRAADDLAETLAQMRAAAEAPMVEMAEPMPDDKCNRWMRVALQFCGRRIGHGGSCRSYREMRERSARRSPERKRLWAERKSA